MATAKQVEEFLSQIAPLVQKYAKERGYKYPSAIIAQAILESGVTSTLAVKYHNYFGMKCGSSWKGKSVNMSTKEEYTVGTLTSIKDNFRVYDSMKEGVKGYFDFISAKRYANLKDATSSRNYLELIKSDGYATSSKYVDNTYAVVEKYGLLKYDREDVKSASTTTAKKPAATGVPYVVRVTASALNVRCGSSTEHGKKGVLTKGQVVTIIEEENGWGRLKSKLGWICLEYTDRVQE